MSSRFALFCSLGFASLAWADPPVGKIIIRPDATPTVVPAVPSIERPGYIVIRPQKPGARVLESPTAAPAPAAPTTPVSNLPLPDPKPIPDPKPAEQAPKQPDAKAKADEGKLIAETWDVAFVKGQKVGYFHVVIREYKRDNKTFIYATKRQEITMARFGQKVTTSAEDATLETPEGAVLTVRMTQEISTGQKLSVIGRVDGQMLRIEGSGLAKQAESILWPEGVIGFAKEMDFYKDRKPKAGDTLEYSIYEGRLNKVVKVTVKCLAQESVALIEGQAPKPYLKCEAQMEKLGDFEFPPATVWVDAATFEPQRTDQDMPSLGGKLTLLRTTKDIAQRPVGDVPDIFDVQSIKLDREIPDVHNKASITYTIDLANDRNPLTCFPKDAFSNRQVPILTDKVKRIVQLKMVHGKLASFHAPEDPKQTPTEADLRDKYTAANFFIDWENDLTKKQAAQAVQGLPPTATVEDKAKAIEAWVHKNMKSVDYSQAMAPASETSKNLSGDCTEYAMLAVGLCRANGIPARTALGLVYANGPGGKPVLAYHMWFEIWSKDHWVAYDGTLGRGGVGPAHIRITHASWHNERSFTPLLPVLRVLLAQPKVTIAAVEEMK